GIDERIGLALLQIELRDGGEVRISDGRNIINFGEKEHAGLACVEGHVVRGLDGHGDDALADAVEVDDDFFGLVFFLVLLLIFLFVFFIGVFRRGVLLVAFGLFVFFLFLLFVFLVGDFFLVALRLHRRRLALLQNGGVNAAGDRTLKSGKVQPAD